MTSQNNASQNNASQNDSASEKVAQLQRSLAYANAEIANLKRKNKDAALTSNASAPPVSETLLLLFDMYDEFSRIINLNPEPTPVLHGLHLLLNDLSNRLTSLGLVQVQNVTAQFDPRFASALASPSESDSEVLYVFEVVKSAWAYRSPLSETLVPVREGVVILDSTLP